MTSKIRALGTTLAATGVLAFSVMGAPTTAHADDLYSDEMLQKICDNAPASETNGAIGTCTFESGNVVRTYLDWHRYGDPMTLCSGQQTAQENLIGGTRTTAQTWKVGGKAEVAFPLGLKIEGNGGYEQTESVTSERRTTVKVNPGRKVAVTEGRQMQVVEGRVRVDIEVYDNSGNGGGVMTGTEPHYFSQTVERTAPTSYKEVGTDERACGENWTVDPLAEGSY